MDILNSYNKKQIDVINIIKDLCKSCDIQAYIVGGAVRDSILGKSTKDIDICINKDPKIVIDNLSFVKKYEYHSQFQTSTIEFNNGIVIDLIRCRKETYEKNGSLPIIEPSCIEDDLFRRDFTINSLAYDIINNEIIDLFNGLLDLRNRQLKKIHSNSYAEDPTRIFRAIKYSVRYGLELQDKNEIIRSINKGDINTISSDRIIKELFLMCGEDNWIENLALCNELGVLKLEEHFLGIENCLGSYENINLR
ncbi:MAG: CCA tRNA nucleotidyltransferase, partial [Clostridiaceae bacterium]|nr:CCA tRNA nucleotidyltransferase [Clostridiaceae bacterium]